MDGEIRSAKPPGSGFPVLRTLVFTLLLGLGTAACIHTIAQEGPKMRKSPAPAAKAERSAAGYSLVRPSDAEIDALAADLSPEDRRVILHQGTEPPFCGTLLDNKLKGTYTCRLCGLPLFKSSSKFHSGTGWPSFTEGYDPDHIAEIIDQSHGMVRVEIRCARCDAHLGHVFDDGPPPTGRRYCLNSVSLEFTEDGKPLPRKLKVDQAK